RTDAYGGSVANRARLLHEVLDAVCTVWPSNQVGLRLSPSTTFNDMRDSDPRSHFGEIISSLNRHRLAYLHLIEPNQADQDHGAICVPSREFRPLFEGVLLVCDGYDGAKARAAIADGYADLVAFGKLFIANPDLPARLQANAPLNTPDPATFYGGDAHGYTDYPSLAPA
ncbi:MAG: alkene reductase, partial [Gammaproteobacteria bacterium]|nr:alkene reductase [Gammaproteobacteria bacterium]